MRLFPLLTTTLERCAPGFAALLLLALVPRAATAADERLIPATLNPKRDAQGFQWDIQPNGTVGDGSDDCFDNGMVLEINNSTGGGQRPMMTADGQEYVLSLRFNNNVRVTRRIRVDTEHAIVRYLEVVENSGSTPQRVSLTIHSTLGNNCPSITTDDGSPFTGTFGKNDAGFAAVQAPGQQRPSVLWLMAARHSKNKPYVAIQGNREFRATYTFNLDPKVPVSIVHYVAQRRNLTPGTATQLFAEIYKKGRLVHPLIAANVRKATLNFGTGGGPAVPAEEEAPDKPVLQPLIDLVESAGGKRGDSDLLVFGEAGKISGTVTGSALQVQTANGAATVPLADVAALDGGSGAQRPVRVYLRSGEILSGEVKADDLLLTTSAGLKVAIDPAKIGLLVLRTSAADGSTPPGASGLLLTTAGDCLALAGAQNCTVDAATTWGDLQAPLDQVVRIVPVRVPYTAQRIVLDNKTQLSGLLRGGDLSLNTLRFGTVKLSPRTVREFRRAAADKKPANATEPAPTAAPAISPVATDRAPATPTAPAAPAADSEEDDTDDEPQPEAGPSPLCRLVGDSFLAGTIDLPELHLVTAAGVTVLDPKSLRSLQRPEDAKEGEITFTAKLANNDQVTGEIEERILPIRSGEKVWRVPTAHLIGFVNPAVGNQPPPEVKPTAGTKPFIPASGAGSRRSTIQSLVFREASGQRITIPIVADSGVEPIILSPGTGMVP